MTIKLTNDDFYHILFVSRCLITAAELATVTSDAGRVIFVLQLYGDFNIMIVYFELLVYPLDEQIPHRLETLVVLQHEAALDRSDRWMPDASRLAHVKACVRIGSVWVWRGEPGPSRT